ncbi:MAG: FAD-binding oxidoreductase [Pseudomonadota bacterium]
MAKVAVIGAGIVGVSSAEWLRRDGHEVVLIDPKGPAGETSAGNAGLIAAPSVSPTQYPGVEWRALRDLALGGAFRLDWGRLPHLAPWLFAFWRNSGAARVRELANAIHTIAGDAVEQHRILAAGTPAADFIGEGEWWHLHRSTPPKYNKGIAIKREFGFPVRVVSEAELRDRDPHLNPAYRSAFALGGYGRISDPAAYVQALAAHFQDGGGRLLLTAARDLRPMENGVKVTCEGETLDVDKVVLACGVWTETFARQLGVRSRVISERGYHVECWGANRSPPDGVAYQLTDTLHVGHALRGRFRVTSISEPAGLDSPPSSRAMAYVRRGPRLFYPDLEQDRVTEWMGRRPSTPDSLPLIGAAPDNPNVLFAAGHQHIGLTAGPKTGRLIADLVSSRSPNIDLTPYAPNRFT